LFLIIFLAKIPAPQEIPKLKELSETEINVIMKKSIEDVVNKWKSDLDAQVDKFESNAERLKNFEIMFLKHFEGLCSLYELIHTLKEDADKTTQNLNDLSAQADQILEQLTVMEQHLDQYIMIAEKKNIESGLGNQIQGDSGNYIYQTAIEVSQSIDLIQKDLDEISARIHEPIKEEENLIKMSFQHPVEKDVLTLDKNDFTMILNSFYNSLRTVQFMEQDLLNKIQVVEFEINERKREREGRQMNFIK
jgi:hypothetical protein